MGASYNNWYNDEEYATIEIATLCGDVYFEKYENISADFIVQIITPEEPLTNKVVKVKNRAPQVKSAGGKLESRPYVSTNAVALIIPAYLLDNFTTSPEDEEDGIYVIPNGTKFVISIIGGDISAEDTRILSVYVDEKKDEIRTAGTRTSGTNKAGVNNRNSQSTKYGTRTSGSYH